MGTVVLSVCRRLLWRSSESPGDPAPQAVRVVLVHGITDREDEEQKEVREAKGSEEKEREVDGEVGERATQRAHETWR